MPLTAQCTPAKRSLHRCRPAAKTPVTKPKPPDPKVAALRAHACLNPHQDRVVDPMFAGSDFFDSRDLVQVKYEMVRRVSVDGQPISHSAAAFGFSRPSFYAAQAALQAGGLPALVPKRPGPRRSHKLSAEVMDFLHRERAADGSLSSADLARRIEEHFGRKVHPRSVERALARAEKKTP
jgi:transposase